MLWHFNENTGTNGKVFEFYVRMGQRLISLFSAATDLLRRLSRCSKLTKYQMPNRVFLENVRSRFCNYHWIYGFGVLIVWSSYCVIMSVFSSFFILQYKLEMLKVFLENRGEIFCVQKKMLLTLKSIYFFYCIKCISFS